MVYYVERWSGEISISVLELFWSRTDYYTYTKAVLEQDRLFYNICIGGWGVSPAGPPVTGKSFRVVPCVRTCVRAVLGLVRFRANRGSCSFPFPLCRGRPFPFPFYRAGFSLFPCASICSLFPCEHYEEIDSNEIK